MLPMHHECIMTRTACQCTTSRTARHRFMNSTAPQLVLLPAQQAGSTAAVPNLKPCPPTCSSLRGAMFKHAHFEFPPFSCEHTPRSACLQSTRLHAGSHTRTDYCMHTQASSTRPNRGLPVALPPLTMYFSRSFMWAGSYCLCCVLKIWLAACICRLLTNSAASSCTRPAQACAQSTGCITREEGHGHGGALPTATACPKGTEPPTHLREQGDQEAKPDSNAADCIVCFGTA